MIDKDISNEKFIELIKAGEKKFTNVCIGSYEFTLKKVNLDNVVFEQVAIELSFEDCSMKNTVFSHSNLKTITFDDCDLTGGSMSECSIEAVEIRNCNLEKFSFGVNHAYGGVLNDNYEKCRTDNGFKF
jgi:uncharacterized protein YjbI with pentapeptide repeats